MVQSEELCRTIGETSREPAVRTHPWINFHLDLRPATHKLWMLVGEARSQCDHIMGVPLKPDTASRLHEVYLAKGVHATTAIEGNTLSEEQVQEQIRGGTEVPPSQEYLRQEVQNVLDGCNQIVREIEEQRRIPLSLQRVLDFHALVMRDLPHEDHVVPGEIRECSVGVMTYRGAPWQECKELVRRLCDWLNGPAFNTEDPDMKFGLTLFKAIIAHLYLAWIHPFGDGNGRTARLIEFQILAQSGIPYPAAHLLSNHYNKTRSEYYRHLDLSSKVASGPIKFIEYAMQGFVDGLREQIGFIRAQQWRITWESHVHEVFKGIDGPASERRRKLLLELPDKWTPRDLQRIESAWITRAYATLSQRTFDRDIQALAEMGLLLVRKDLIRPNMPLILAFLPKSSRMTSIDAIQRKGRAMKRLQSEAQPQEEARDAEAPEE